MLPVSLSLLLVLFRPEVRILHCGLLFHCQHTGGVLLAFAASMASRTEVSLLL